MRGGGEQADRVEGPCRCAISGESSFLTQRWCAGERYRQGLDKCCDRCSVLVTVGGIQLRNRQTTEALTAYQDAERPKCRLERQPLIAARMLRERHVGEIYCIHVKMNEQAVDPWLQF